MTTRLDRIKYRRRGCKRPMKLGFSSLLIMGPSATITCPFHKNPVKKLLRLKKM